MATTQERVKVLEMLKEGQITPEAAAQLLEAVEKEPARPVMPQAPLPPARSISIASRSPISSGAAPSPIASWRSNLCPSSEARIACILI